MLLLFVAGCPESSESSKPVEPFDSGGTLGFDTNDDSQDSDSGDPDTDTTWTIDRDSDGDGIADYEEGRAEGTDTDRDGDEDWEDLDSDGDGISDADEGQPMDGFNPADTDGDGTPDFQDDDSDEDGLSDLVETAADLDGDGTPNYRDTDADGDGLDDLTEGNDDWDGDGVDNWEDTLNDGTLSPILFEAITTEFNSPIGIDFHEYTETVVLSVNYSTGDPLALERVESDGTHVGFSSLSGVTDEVKIATVRAGNPSGFLMGELFVGNGVDGQIVRISPDGSVIQNPWVDLPGDSNGLMRGSLYIDRTGLFDYNLVVATTDGEIWMVDSAGAATQIADITGVHLEGLISVPDAPLRYGPLAGTLIAGAEAVGLLYSVSRDGVVTSYDIGVEVEDLDLVTPHENFFGVNYGTSRLVGAGSYQFLPIAGDILVTMELVTQVGLYRLHWNGTELLTEELPATSDSATIGQWEHVTFARAGIQEVP